jgi:hypothetical protein
VKLNRKSPQLNVPRALILNDANYLCCDSYIRSVDVEH